MNRSRVCSRNQDVKYRLLPVSVVAGGFFFNLQKPQLYILFNGSCESVLQTAEECQTGRSH